MKNTIITIIVVGFILYLLKIYFLPKSEIYFKNDKYKILNDKGEYISAKIFNNKNYYIIIFTEENQRVHINFDDESLGLPNYGSENYILSKDDKKLYLMKESIFYNDGNLYYAFMPGEIKYKFYSQEIEFETPYLLKRLGNKIYMRRISPTQKNY